MLVLAFFTLGDVRLYVNTRFILLLFFFVFSWRSFCLSKVLVLFITRLFLVLCILFQLTSYIIYCNCPEIYCVLRRCSEDAKLAQMVCFVLKIQDALTYYVIKPIDWILSCRALYQVYLNVFYNNSVAEIYLFIRKFKVKFHRWVDFINLLFKFH